MNNNINNKLSTASPVFINKNDQLYINAQNIKPICEFEDIVVHSDADNFYLYGNDGMWKIFKPGEALMDNIYQKINFDLPITGVRLAIPQKDKILSHLKSGEIVAAAAGRAFDIVTGVRIPYEWVIFTDDEYQWDTSLIYHFDKYNIALPKDFVEHIINLKYSR